MCSWFQAYSKEQLESEARRQLSPLFPPGTVIGPWQSIPEEIKEAKGGCLAKLKINISNINGCFMQNTPESLVFNAATLHSVYTKSDILYSHSEHLDQQL